MSFWVPPNLLVFLIRVGVVCQMAIVGLYIFWSSGLLVIAEKLPLHQALVKQIENYPGFGADWLSVASLITVAMYIYGYLVLVLVITFLFLRGNDEVYHSIEDGRSKDLLAYIVMGRPYLNRNSNVSLVGKRRMRSVMLELLPVICLGYIAYASLQKPPTVSGLFTRVMDSFLVAFWCYCIFSIFLWLVLLLVSYVKNPLKS